MSNANADLERYLRACYPDHVRTDTPERQAWAASTAKAAYPDLRTPFDFVFLRSRRRHTEQYGKGRTVILDDGQASLLSLADAMMLDRDYHRDGGLSVWLVPFAEGFLSMADVERALMTAVMAHDHRNLLAALRDQRAKMQGGRATELALVLHEVAHFAVDAGAEFTRPMERHVRAALGDLVSANEDLAVRLASGESLAGLDISFGDGPSEARSLMTSQTRDHIALIKDSAEVVREGTCDLVALDALLKLRIGEGYDADKLRVTGVTYREIADLMLLSLRTSRLLAAQGFVRQSVETIALGTDPSVIDMSLSSLTARASVMANVVLGWFEDIVANAEFETPFAPNDPAGGQDPVPRFQAAVEAVHARSVGRVLNPIEEIGLFCRDRDLCESAVKEIKAKRFGTIEPTRDQMEAACRELIATLPL